MEKRFEDAVGEVKAYLKTGNYSYSITMCHLRCYKLLGAYLADAGKLYCEHLAKQWLQGIAHKLCGSTVITYKNALRKLDAFYHHKEIDNSKAKYDAQQNYCNLVIWCKTLLDTFLEEMSGTCKRSYLQALRISVSRFLRYATNKGCCKPQDITHRIIVDYYRDDEHVSYKSKNAYNNRVCKFLRYLSDKGLIQASFCLTLDQFILPRLVFIDTLADKEQETFRMNCGVSIMNANTYYEKVLEMDAIIHRHKYSKTMKMTFSIALRELFVFLEANSLGYSIDTALAWVNHIRQFNNQWKAYRRAMMLFEQYRTGGEINPQKVYTYKANRIDALPAWCKESYEAFNLLKEKEGFAKSTLDMYRSSCLRLLEYLHADGISSWEAVTPQKLKAFHLQDHHSTPEGKNAYSSKIRNFLEYLGDIGKVSPTLFLAVPNEAAPCTNIIRTLNDNEAAQICRKQKQALDALELRGMAIILIGLRMGLRASDITKMKFSDISWKQKTISILQQKTGKFLKLPMPTVVGNALYRYITQGRPDASSSDYIFISHRVPYNRLHPAACQRALKAVVGCCATEQSIGFHVTRKTFASQMLANNVCTNRIAETLGHVSNKTVMPYLATNNENMRLCALPLARLPVNGGVLS